MWNIVNRSIPRTIRDHITVNDNNTLFTRPARLKSFANNFKHRTLKTWNKLPTQIRTENKLVSFKKQTKTWIIGNINLNPG